MSPRAGANAQRQHAWQPVPNREHKRRAEYEYILTDTFDGLLKSAQVKKRKCPGSRGTSVLPSGADMVCLPQHVRQPKGDIGVRNVGQQSCLTARAGSGCCGQIRHSLPIKRNLPPATRPTPTSCKRAPSSAHVALDAASKVRRAADDGGAGTVRKRGEFNRLQPRQQGL